MMSDINTSEPLYSQEFLRTYKESEIIFEEGSKGIEMYLIHSGKVLLSTKQADAEAVTLAILNPGDFFGEMSLVDDFVRSATAVAAEDNTRIMALDRQKFVFMVRQHPQFALSVMHTLCDRMRSLDKQLSLQGDPV